MCTKASLVKGQVWSPFAAVWEKRKERYLYIVRPLLVKGQVWSSFAAVWKKNKERHVYLGFFSEETSWVLICSCVGENSKERHVY